MGKLGPYNKLFLGIGIFGIVMSFILLPIGMLGKNPYLVACALIIACSGTISAVAGSTVKEWRIEG